jgi:predicted transcriptional regulator
MDSQDDGSSGSVRLRAKTISKYFKLRSPDIEHLIVEIIKREPGLDHAKALRKHVVKISILNVLQEERPKSIRELAQRIGMTERQTWIHVKELREWGRLPEDAYTRKRREGEN